MLYRDLKRKYMLKEITEEEYEKEKTLIIERLLDLYAMDMLTKEQFLEKLNIL